MTDEYTVILSRDEIDTLTRALDAQLLQLMRDGASMASLEVVSARIDQLENMK